MSVHIPISILYENKLHPPLFTSKETTYSPSFQIHAYRFGDGDTIYVPYWFARINKLLPYAITTPYTAGNPPWILTSQLRDDQTPVMTEHMNNLNTTHCSVLALRPGAGKTVLAISTLANLQRRFMILVHRVNLIHQWAARFKQHSTANIAIIQPKHIKNLPDIINNMKIDGFIMMAANVPKCHDIHPNCWEYANIGVVIADEVHLFATRSLSQSLTYFTPEYVVALSATPYRYDGMDGIIKVFFGIRFIHRKLEMEYDVYKVNTGIRIKMQKRGSTLDWSGILDIQAGLVRRNRLIVSITKWILEQDSNRRILILSKRKEQCQALYDEIVPFVKDTLAYMGTIQTIPDNCRVLIGIVSKCGVGMDKDLDTLIMGCDSVSYYEQYIGRVFRSDKTRAWIFDLVDENIILEKHYEQRRLVYENSGATIHNVPAELFRP